MPLRLYGTSLGPSEAKHDETRPVQSEIFKLSRMLGTTPLDGNNIIWGPL